MPNVEELLHVKQQRIDELHRCVAGRTALIVVDMQCGFLQPGAALEMPMGRDIVPNVRRLIDVCRGADVPVVFTEFVYDTAVPCLRGDPFGPEHLPHEAGKPRGFGHPSSNCLIAPDYDEGPDSGATVPELAPLPGELVVRAHTYDKFYATCLDLALRARDIRWLIFTGVATDICVASTLMSAAIRDYRCTAVTDACATIDDKLQLACFTIWQRKYARLRTTEQMLPELRALRPQ
jgi:nicotinamidase-related amidase